MAEKLAASGNYDKPKILQRLYATNAEILTDPSDCWPYGSDNSRLHRLPAIVVLVENHKQTVQVMQVCNDFNIPVTARGRGTGTAGAAVPSIGGLVISFERMCKIIDFNLTNRTLCAESGITNRAIQDFCKPHGLFWPPDPGSADFCTLGGNIACNAAGPRAIKYGTTRENTLGLKAVTGGGQEIITGTQTSKGVVGLDLTRLLIGSEGTMALVTEAVIKLTPVPTHRKTMQVFYRNIEGAAAAVADILSQAFTPCILELMDKSCIRLIQEHTHLEIPNNAQAMLLIEADGNKETSEIAAAAIRQKAENHDSILFNLAENDAAAQALYSARKILSPTLRQLASGKINEDIVVPISKLAVLIKEIETLSKLHQLTIVSFGHAGNGNLHINILFDADNLMQTKVANNCLRDIFTKVLQLGGTLSGEHGTGLTKRDYVGWEVPIESLQLMRDITNVFDPKNILNCDKKPLAEKLL